MSFMELHAHYIGLLVCPLRLSADYSANVFVPIDTIADPRNAFTLVVYLMVVVLVLCGAMKDGRLFSVMAWVVVPLVPAMNIVQYVGTVIGERLLYMPSVGSSLLLSLGLQRLSRAVDRQACSISGATLTRTIAVAVTAFYVARTTARNPDWHSTWTVFNSALHTYPVNVKMQYSIAHYLMHLGQASSARPLIISAYEGYPTDPQILSLMVTQLLNDNNVTGVVSVLRRCVATPKIRKPLFKYCNCELAHIYNMLHNTTGALELSSACTHFYPTPDNLLTYGRALARARRYDLAMESFSQGLALADLNWGSNKAIAAFESFVLTVVETKGKDAAQKLIVELQSSHTFPNALRGKLKRLTASSSNCRLHDLRGFLFGAPTTNLALKYDIMPQIFVAS